MTLVFTHLDSVTRIPPDEDKAYLLGRIHLPAAVVTRLPQASVHSPLRRRNRIPPVLSPPPHSGRRPWTVSTECIRVSAVRHCHECVADSSESTWFFVTLFVSCRIYECHQVSLSATGLCASVTDCRHTHCHQGLSHWQHRQSSHLGIDCFDLGASLSGDSRRKTG